MLDALKESWYWILIAVIVIVTIILVICLRPKKEMEKQADETEKQASETEKPQVTKVEAKADDEVIKEEPKPAEEIAEDSSEEESSRDDNDDEDEITFESTEELDEEETEEVKKEESNRPKKYRISYDREQKMWLIKKDGAKRVIRKTGTKVEALEIAKRMCNNQDLNLVVHKKDGKFQKKKNLHL